jgi:hypothetical protein
MILLAVFVGEQILSVSPATDEFIDIAGSTLDTREKKEDRDIDGDGGWVLLLFVLFLLGIYIYNCIRLFHFQCTGYYNTNKFKLTSVSSDDEISLSGWIIRLLIFDVPVIVQ